MGLLENSSVVLVASMLVSPIMGRNMLMKCRLTLFQSPGPILAGIFGGVIGDWVLARRGIRHEIYSLFLCILIGFILGLFISPFARMYGCSQWPTAEMLGRGEWRALWVGVLIAVPSGAGVALSVLGGNAGSLVGVAISASLLPPAVNCGLFWATAIVEAISASLSPDHKSHFYGLGEEANATVSLYEPRYDSDNMSLEAFYLGLISLTLTIVNILCIILTGVFILRVKEVTSEKIPQKFAHFWTKDIKKHRKDLQAHKGYEKKFRKEDPMATKLIGAVPAEVSPEEDVNLDGTFLQSLFDRMTQDEDIINIRQWVPMPGSTIVPDHSYKRVSRPSPLQPDPPSPACASLPCGRPLHGSLATLSTAQLSRQR